MAPDVAPQAPAGRRERRKAETRRRLLQAARRLFVEEGYEETRPQDIARAADVATGTFYVHFPDKRAAFLAFSDEVADELLAFIHSRRLGTSGFEAPLRRSLEALLDYSDANPGLLRATAADAAVGAAHLPPGAGVRERLANDLAERLRAAMQRGEVPGDFDAELIAHGVVGFVHYALAHAANEHPHRPAMLRNIERFLTRALSAGPS